MRATDLVVYAAGVAAAVLLVLDGMAAMAREAALPESPAPLAAPPAPPDSAALDGIRAACKEPPKIPEGGHALADAHIRVPIDAVPADFAIALLRAMNEAGISRAVLRSETTTQKRDPLVMEHLRRIDAALGQVARACPRIVPLVYGFDPDDTGAWRYVEQRLATGLYGGVGAIEFSHPETPTRYAIDSPAMTRIYELLNRHSLALHFHASEAADPGFGEDFAAIAGRYPRTQFVWSGDRPPDGDAWEVPNLWFTTVVHPERYVPDAKSAPRLIWGSETTPQALKEAAGGARKALHGLHPHHLARVSRSNFDLVWPPFARQADNEP